MSGVLDSDSDGMDDDFEVAHFGDLSRDGDGDADADGNTDRQEFLAGTNPTDNDSILRVIAIRIAGGDARQLIWVSVAGRSYAVQFKDDLNEPWATLSGTVRATGATTAKVDGSSTPARFYRVLLAE